MVFWEALIKKLRLSDIIDLKLELEAQNPLEGAILARRNVGNSVNPVEKLLNIQVGSTLDSK